MSLLKKFNEELQLNQEGIGASCGYVEMNLEDEIIAAEEESELNDTIDEAETTGEVMDEAEEVIDELEEKIEEGKAVVAAAEAAAENNGEVPTPTEEAPIVDEDGVEVPAEDVAEAAETLDDNGEVPADEVVAVQESLRAVIRKTGFSPEFVNASGISLSREDIRSNTLEAYKQNLEGLKDIAGKVKELASKAWEKIKQAFNWVKDKIMSVMPTKVNRMKALRKRLDEKGGKDISKEDFKKIFGDKYAALVSVIGDDLAGTFKFAADDAKAQADALAKGFEAFKGTQDKLKDSISKMETLLANNTREDGNITNATGASQSVGSFEEEIKKAKDQLKGKVADYIKASFVNGDSTVSADLVKRFSKLNEDINKVKADDEKLGNVALKSVKFSGDTMTGTFLFVVTNKDGDEDIKSVVSTQKVASVAKEFKVADIKAAIDAYTKAGSITQDAFTKSNKIVNDFYDAEKKIEMSANSVKNNKVVAAFKNLYARLKMRMISSSSRRLVRSMLSGFKTLNSDYFGFVMVLGATALKLKASDKK